MKGMPRPTRPNKRDRYLKGLEIQSVWAATSAEPWPYGYLAQLMLLTAQRRSEVAGMRWDEFNLPNGTWTIPGSRTKNGKDHIVPISNFAAEIILNIRPVPLKRQPGEAVTFSPYVFPRPKNPAEPMKWFADAKARMEKRADVKDWTLHDMRRTAASTFGEFGVDIKARKKILNHAENSVTDIYDRFDYFEQRCEALHLWAEHVRKAIVGEITAPSAPTRGLNSLGAHTTSSAPRHFNPTSTYQYFP